MNRSRLHIALKNTVKTAHQSFLKSVASLIVLLSFANPAQLMAAKTETKAISEVTVLGIKLLTADLNEVRAQLWNIGGFLQAKSSVKQSNYDKFFPWSNTRDSYYVTFNYNHAGNITTVKRLYRPSSIEFSNRKTPIQTRDVALKLIQEIGQPTLTQRKGWGGTLRYHAYTWEDENMTITIDREGSDKLGNVFIRYTLKNHPPYEVIIDDEKNA